MFALVIYVATVIPISPDNLYEHSLSIVVHFDTRFAAELLSKRLSDVLHVVHFRLQSMDKRVPLSCITLPFPNLHLLATSTSQSEHQNHHVSLLLKIIVLQVSTVI